MVQFLQMEIFIQKIHHHPRNLGSKIQLNRWNRLDAWCDYVFCYCAIAHTWPYCVKVIMVTIISSHIFSNIFQTVHFSAAEFTREKYELSSDTKSHKVLRKSKAIRLSSFKSKIYLKFILFVNKIIILDHRGTFWSI